MLGGMLRGRYLLFACGAFALLFAGLWVATAGGLAPAALPGISPPQLLTQVVGKLAGVLYQLLAALPVLVGLWAGSAGLGSAALGLCGTPARHGLVLQLATGLALMLLFDWALAWAGLLNAWTAWGLCVVGVGVLAWQLSAPRRRSVWELDRWVSPPWTTLTALPVLGLMLVAACCPPGALWAVEGFGYDSLSYHLQLPREWLAAGAMRGLEHNVFSYLPSLVETGYMQVAAMHGSVTAAVYTIHFFHAGAAVLAALALACLVSRFVSRAAGALAGAAFLAMPWTIITATSAYNEMAALALAGAALLLLHDPLGQTRRGTLAAAVLLGAATLAKLTIGLLMVPALALVVLLRLDRPALSDCLPTWRSAVGRTLLLALASALTVAPWLARNAAWTGNPLFPFAADRLGRAHWQADNIDRWQRSTQPDHALAQIPRMLARRWVFSPGYGAVAGLAGGDGTSATTHDVTGFHRAAGLPVLWLTALVGAVLGLRRATTRRLTAAMLLMLAVQLLAWCLLTHRQARFLLPTLVPACVLAGLAAGRLEAQVRGRSSAWLWPAGSWLLMALLIANAMDVYLHQQRRVEIDGRLQRVPPWQMIDSLPTGSDAPSALAAGSLPGDHVLNYLAPPNRTLMVADAAVLYINAPIAYNSAFDANALGTLLRQHPDNPLAVTRALRQAGFTHLWVNWSELNRLRTTYGYDPAVTPQALRQLLGSWQVAVDYGWAGLYMAP